MSREFQSGKGSYFCFGPKLLRNDSSLRLMVKWTEKQGQLKSTVGEGGAQAPCCVQCKTLLLRQLLECV